MSPGSNHCVLGLVIDYLYEGDIIRSPRIESREITEFTDDKHYSILLTCVSVLEIAVNSLCVTPRRP